MKKLTYITLIFAVCCKVNAVDFRTVSGKIEFPVAVVNGIVCWTANERNEITNSLGTHKAQISSMTYTITIATPTQSANEVNLSTCAVSGISADAFRSNTKIGLVKEIEKVRTKYDFYNDLDPTDAEAKDYKARYEWLKAYYGTIP